MPFATALSGACFLIASFYLIKDRAVVKATVTGHSEENRTLLNHGEYDDDSVTDNDVSNDVLHGDVVNNDVRNDEIISDNVRSDDIGVDVVMAGDDVRADDVRVDDGIDNNGLAQPGQGVQCDTSGDSVSDDMETRQHLVNV